MNAREQGFLLLSSHLGDPDRKVLTTAQLRNLFLRVNSASGQCADRDLTAEDVAALGYDMDAAQRIALLLSQREQLDWYMKRAKKSGCYAITRISQGYPNSLRQKLGIDCPACLWAKGNLNLLELPGVALVGSRKLCRGNEAFAKEVGRQAARQGYVLISGNAAGADRTAQEACLQAGGRVISIVADSLEQWPGAENILYLSEDGFDLPFTAVRALSRNRLIHAMGKITFVAQCTLEKGGTWDGTKNNLKKSYSPVFCYADGAKATQALLEMGADGVDIAALSDFFQLKPSRENLFFA